MHESQRKQIGRIIDDETINSRALLSHALATIQDNYARAGRSGSVTEVAFVADKVGQYYQVLLSQLTTRVAAVSKTPEAFDEIASAMERWLRSCEEEMRVLTGTGPLLSTAGQKEFTRLTEGVERWLEMERFDFNAPAPKEAAATLMATKKGGRPPAEFWDDMWAEIAVSLYNGDLDPKTQADVERAMATWIDANGHSAADSTIRGRARRLWDRIARSDA